MMPRGRPCGRSPRARITATRFTNHYEWGDFRGDPRKLMERWFDLHLYYANWGTRRLMIRWPARLLERKALEPFLDVIDGVELLDAGDKLVVDIHRDEDEPDYLGMDEDEDESGLLARLAPLRADVASGDLRLFYLVWLIGVQHEDVAEGDVEPLPGIGKLSDALEAFADFFGVDPHLVQAAAERGARAEPSADALRRAISAISDRERIELLARVADGDAHVAAEIRRRARMTHPPSALPRRAGALRARAAEIAAAHERAEAERRAAAQSRAALEAKKAQRARLTELRQRGDAVWQEISTEIARRNPAGYDRATSLLSDLQALAAEDGNGDAFDRRIASIRATHQAKGRFIERLDRLGLRGEGQ